MSKNPNKHAVAKALATAFGVPLQSDKTRLEEMDYARVQVYQSEEFPLISVIGPEIAWTFMVEFAQDDTGDIEAYGAGQVLLPEVVERLTEANVRLNGFLVGGLRMYALNGQYDAEERALSLKLMDRIEALQGRPQHAQA